MVLFGALGELLYAFLQSQIADRLPHTFQEASGVYFWSQLGSKKTFVLFVSVPLEEVFSLDFTSTVATRLLSQSVSSHVGRKGTDGFRPTKTDVF